MRELEERLRETTEQRLRELDPRFQVEGTSPPIFVNKPYYIQTLYDGTFYLDTDRIGGLTIGSHVRPKAIDRSDFQKWILERSSNGYFIKSILGGYLTAGDYGRAGSALTLTLTA